MSTHDGSSGASGASGRASPRGPTAATAHADASKPARVIPQLRIFLDLRTEKQFLFTSTEQSS